VISNGFPLRYTLICLSLPELVDDLVGCGVSGLLKMTLFAESKIFIMIPFDVHTPSILIHFSSLLMCITNSARESMQLCFTAVSTLLYSYVSIEALEQPFPSYDFLPSLGLIDYELLLATHLGCPFLLSLFHRFSPGTVCHFCNPMFSLSCASN
jgi:hypothetical protein